MLVAAALGKQVTGELVQAGADSMGLSDSSTGIFTQQNTLHSVSEQVLQRVQKQQKDSEERIKKQEAFPVGTLQKSEPRIQTIKGMKPTAAVNAEPKISSKPVNQATRDVCSECSRNSERSVTTAGAPPSC